MAIGNWDVVAFDEQGKHTRAMCRLDETTQLEIYKSSVYLQHGAAAAPVPLPVCPVDVEDWSPAQTPDASRDKMPPGLRLRRLASPEGVFVDIQWAAGEHLRRFCGIGCYGYAGEEWVGVTPKTFQEFLAWLDDEAYVQKIQSENP